jgi:DNA-binding XRE family transcriptional regulator
MLSNEQLQTLRAEPIGGARNKVRRARELAGLTQVQLGQRIRKTQAFISAIEIGDYADMALTTSQDLARELGCTVDDIFPMREAVA